MYRLCDLEMKVCVHVDFVHGRVYELIQLLKGPIQKPGTEYFPVLPDLRSAIILYDTLSSSASFFD